MSYTFRTLENVTNIDIDAIHGLLQDTYWASERTRDEVEESLGQSVVMAAYEPTGGLVGCARAVTDRVTFAWICDVVVATDHRGKGIGKTLVRGLLEHPDVSRTRKILVTKDAQKLYRDIGFERHKFECMIKYPEKPQQAHTGCVTLRR